MGTWSNSARGRGAKILSLIFLAGLAAAPWSSATAAQREPARVVTSVAQPSRSRPVATARNRPEWQRAMARLPAPSSGCFRSSFPRIEWQATACVTPPNLPYPPAAGPHTYSVGNGVDYSALVTGNMIGATGSQTTSGITSETGQVGGAGGQVANTYSLQLNAKPFSTPVCNNGSCQGWQQFIYSSSSQQIFIQYWLLQYTLPCPAGWNTYGSSYCWRNGAGGAAVAIQPVSNLPNMKLSGTAVAGGTDTVSLDIGGGSIFSAANPDNILNLAAGWKGVEYVLVGDCCGTQANFNAGSTMVVTTTVHNNTTIAPTCLLEGYTGETNNLTLVGTPAIPIGPSPQLVSTQSNIAGSPASCAVASGLGDTHLTTIAGLLYDFQAAGDFLLAETGPDFVVQVRQVSGAPTWPNATVNKAVGMRIGRARVSICLGEAPLRIDGKAVDLASGASIDLAGGGDIRRTGNVYLVRSASGDSVRIELNPTWINVWVGVGRWPSPMRGLLASATGHPNTIVARDGTVLTSPFSADDLYHRFGDSWRVSAREALCDCGDRPIEQRNPDRPFYARDLAPDLYKKARAVCLEAKVREGSLLDACTLDVAVIGHPAAARTFVNAPAPRAVGEVVARPYSNLPGRR